MASLKEQMNSQLNSSYKGVKKVGKLEALLHKDDREEIVENLKEKGIEIEEIKSKEKLVKEQNDEKLKINKNARDEKPIGIMLYLNEDNYDKFDLILSKGKRLTKRGIGLTLTQGELVALMTDYFHENVFSDQARFQKMVLDYVSPRKQAKS